jgi:zinc/manganese transport system ATP-binding protein
VRTIRDRGVEHDDQDPDRPGEATGATAVALRAVAARRGGRTIWSDLSLEVKAGEFVAVLGPNGAGKSTLLQVLLGLLPPASGSVEVLGQRPIDARRHIGYLPQRRNFDPGLRVRGIDVVRLGADGTRWGTPLPLIDRLRGSDQRRDERERVDDAIQLVGATSYAHRPVGQISGGEQQRLLIAQALVRQPKLLLLDEPLDSLDLPNQHAVAGLIKQVCALGVTVIIVAHDVNPIMSYLDTVVYIARGQALAGPPAQVITSENLSHLYGTTIDVLRASDGRLVVAGQPDAPAFHALG